MSPKTGAALNFTDLYPNHEKKAEISRWSDLNSPREEPMTTKQRLGALIWVTTPFQAVEELNNLGRLVELDACELKQPQLSRMLMCLMADDRLWTMEVQRAFQALQEQCLGLAARSMASANPLDADEVRTRPAKRKRDEIWRKCLKRAGQNPLVPKGDESPQSATNCSEGWLLAPTYISGSSRAEAKVNAAEIPAPLTQRTADQHVSLVWNTEATSGSAGDDGSMESVASLLPNDGEVLDSLETTIVV